MAAKLLTTVQAAELLKRHPQTLVQWRAWNLGPKFIREGQSVRYRLEEVERFKKMRAKSP